MTPSPQKSPIFLLFLLYLSILSLAFFALDYRTASAALAPGFGGTVFTIIPCVNGFLSIVGLPRPGLFMFMPGISMLHAFFLPHPGAWVLGNYFFGGACVCPYLDCQAGAIPAIGTIIHMGTSF